MDEFMCKAVKVRTGWIPSHFRLKNRFYAIEGREDVQMTRAETALNSVYTYTYTGRKMVSKNISITEDVYDLLSKVKLEDESFSDAIARLIRSGGKLSECAGLWKDMSKEELEELRVGVEEARKSADERLRKVEIA